MKTRTKNNSPASEKKEGRLSGLKALAIPASAVLLAVLLNTFFIILAVVPSGSMDDTIKEDSVILANRLAYVSQTPQRGDIVLFYNKELTSNLLVKRIIAIPGDSVRIENGRVFLNGASEPADEPYVDVFSTDSMEEITVPEGCYFLMGDNRNNSIDSRFWDDPFVKESNIKAKVVLTLLPKPGKLK